MNIKQKFSFPKIEIADLLLPMLIIFVAMLSTGREDMDGGRWGLYTLSELLEKSNITSGDCSVTNFNKGISTAIIRVGVAFHLAGNFFLYSFILAFVFSVLYAIFGKSRLFIRLITLMLTIGILFSGCSRIA